MASVYEIMTTPLVENTVMQKVYVNGVHKVYTIAPIDGYVLHKNEMDWEEEDGTFYRGYTTGNASCAASYDFAATTIIDGYTAYGPREFFARPESEVPADQIFGGGDNNHEIM